MRRDVYSGNLRLFGEEDSGTLNEANNYALSLFQCKRFEEARSLLRKAMPVARRTLGAEHDLTLNLRDIYAQCLYSDDNASRGDVVEAIEILEDVDRRVRRVFGNDHPNWRLLPIYLAGAREKLASFDT